MHSSPPPSIDRWEHEFTTLLGIALTRCQTASQEAAAHAETCADVLAGLPDDCRAHLQAEGRADAWRGAIDLLRAALEAKRGAP